MHVRQRIKGSIRRCIVGLAARAQLCSDRREELERRQRRAVGCRSDAHGAAHLHKTSLCRQFPDVALQV